MRKVVPFILALILAVPSTVAAPADTRVATASPTHRLAASKVAHTAPGSQSSSSIASTGQIMHVLNRLTFGPKPGDVEAVQKMGLEAYIEQQLRPETIPESPIVTQYVQSCDALRYSPVDLYNEYGPPAQRADRQSTMQKTIVFDRRSNNRFKRDFGHEVYSQITRVKLVRATQSPRQLQEVMADFWFNHFNVCFDKDNDRFWTGAYEERAIRPYALGKFRDLVEATCHHPAMLYYLDNWQNSANGTKVGNKVVGLNENYARELMELHTLGVDGGYTQKDVTELARILTGLGLVKMDGKLNSASGGDYRTGCTFDASRHDKGTKKLLGYTIAGSGEGEIEQALTILLRHPSTAHHISYQLVQYFVSDTPPKGLVDKVAAVFTRTDGDIKSCLSTIFHSPEFWATQNEDNKFKNPFRYLVSTLRAADAQPTHFDFATEFLKAQGMPMYRCLTPDGYKNTRDAWCNPDTLLKRVTFASDISVGRVPDVPAWAVEYRRLGATLGSTFSGQTVRVIMKYPELVRSTLVLGSPEFMKY